MKRKGRKLNVGTAFLRAIVQSLAWLPITLWLAPAAPAASLGQWLALAAAASLFGAALTIGSYLWPWAVYAALIAAVAGSVARLGIDWLLPMLYAGVAAWLAGRSLPREAVCMAGVGTNGLALIAAVWVSELAAYRPLFIVSGLIWFTLSAYAIHAKLLNSAGLHDGIVTRLVSRSSRRCLMLLLAVVIIAYLATSDFHLWRAIVEFINAHTPRPSPPESEPMQQAPSGGLPEGLLGEQSESRWPRWTDYLFYGIAGAIGAAVLILLVKRYVLNLSWFRALVSWVRALLPRLFERKPPPVQAPYTEEKESLLDIGRALREARSRWLHRASRKPLGRREWEQLAAREKVRRLYQESLLTAAEAGFSRRSSDTPSEALDAAARWYEGHEEEGAAARKSAVSPRSGWLRQKRALLADLYGRARYGSREATPAELEKLAGEYPWDSRK
ncbi:DUF4129 domain-containing protein [Cohnella lubricantis]|uniref:DUF4129 domain-containing protein n=1 Tax=Cohnella lubricantis TaxID=2163172 RepID=A0A841TGH4_9BACL|nr:DUF4129 domain-containing protein [Cohnella lubricantis]MBB6679466.1 DUF4129 domain-containing protein [Cohnella lubricantis]MBP2118203.1 hypothetical protein [Cohnella lubricantis]